MIYFYSGTPGSGKSYHVAQVIYDALKKGKNVLANFDVSDDTIKRKKKTGYFFNLNNTYLTVPNLVGFCDNFHKYARDGTIIEGQTYIVIDECSILFDARTWNDPKRRLWVQFFQQHRKYGYDIFFISQNDRNIDRQIRTMFEYEVKHRKVNNFKLAGRVLGFLSGGALFSTVSYWYKEKERIRCKLIPCRKKIRKFYNTHKRFDGAMRG